VVEKMQGVIVQAALNRGLPATAAVHQHDGWKGTVTRGLEQFCYQKAMLGAGGLRRLK
jgi:hypothetical protein